MSAAEYRAPAAVGEAELTEKRSKFIGFVCPISSEDEAKAEIARIRTKYHDARHHAWCYITGGIERYSDDGEPQGTAGMPMLEIFRRGGITNVVSVVTRYFGGILLGPGGLSRAYSGAAKLALDAAGITLYRLWDSMDIACPYNLAERIKIEIEARGGTVADIEYGAEVIIHAALPQGVAEGLNSRIIDMSAGAVTGIITGQQFAAER